MKKIILSFLILASSNVNANSLTLTCDFEYSRILGAINEVPANCTKKLNELLKEKYSGKKSFLNRSGFPNNLKREEYMSARAPKCPEGYNDLDIYQGGVIAYGRSEKYMSTGDNEHYFYQTRRICINN